MFLDMAAKYDVRLHTRKVEKSSLSFIMPNDGKRAIVRCRDDHYLTPFPALDLTGCRALHLDGHQPDAALSYAQRCRERRHSDVARRRRRASQHPRAARHSSTSRWWRSASASRWTRRRRRCSTISRAAACKIGGVTQGERGVLWYDESGEVRHLPALPCRRRVCATPAAPATCFTAPMSIPISPIRSKAGTSISGSRQRAAAYKIQHLGNEAGLPTLEDIEDDCARVRSGTRRRAPAGARQASPRCRAAADRTRSSSSATGQRRRQFGCSVTVPGTLT